MNASLAILSVGAVPAKEIIPQLIPGLCAEDLLCLSLVGNLSRSQVLADYAPQADEETFFTMLADRQPVALSHARVEHSLQGMIDVLEHQGVEVIWLMALAGFTRLKARCAVLLEPQRMVPPLVASIVDGHRVGVLLPFNELRDYQASKWQGLAMPPLFATWNAGQGGQEALLTAGKQLLKDGAQVLVLDSPSYHPADRETLEQHLETPVLLSSGLVAKVAEELLL